MAEQDKNTGWYVVAILAFVCMLTVNAMANILPLNGLNTGDVANRYLNLFLPAALTFSIWSVIYGLLIVFFILGWRWRHHGFIAKIIPYVALSCVLNLSWIIVWHYLFPGLSVLIMLGLLVTLAIIFKIVQQERSSDLKIKGWLSLSFTIYFAWICVATIANIAAFLVSIDWRGDVFSEQVWTLIMMSIAAVLALKITSKFHTTSFSLVVIWALLGIFIRWFESSNHLVVYGSVILVILLTIHVIYINHKHPSVI